MRVRLISNSLLFWRVQHRCNNWSQKVFLPTTLPNAIGTYYAIGNILLLYSIKTGWNCRV
jgi:hypothetical protein